MPARQKHSESEACECTAITQPDRAPQREQGPDWRPNPNLRDLIPIAVAIASGCEPCAESAVKQALKQGSPKQHIEETLRIVAYLRTLDCLIRSAGSEAVARMEKPLSAAARTLQHSVETRDE